MCDSVPQQATRLAIGTAQFGMPYGVANTAGQVSLDEGAAILDQAWTAGIDTLDTAVLYDESEQRLGRIGVAGWKVISKLPAIPEGTPNVMAWVRESIEASLRRLRVSRLHGLLLHRPQQLRGPQGEELYQALADVKNEGTVGRIGISINSPSQLDALWPEYRFDVVQAPMNVLDRRLVTSGWLFKLRESGTELHARSVFLQGLLLMMHERRPPYFGRWDGLWKRWHDWLKQCRLTPQQACLGFVLSYPEVGRAVIGVDSPAQLRELIAASATPARPPAEVMTEDLDLIQPSRWSTP